jgi:hypothetical protein
MSLPAETQQPAAATSSRGRPSRYDPLRHLMVARALAKTGHNLRQIAVALEISPRTLFNWRARYKPLDAAIRAGTDFAVSEVEKSLYARAVGGWYTEEKTSVKTRPRAGSPPGEPPVQTIRHVRHRKYLPGNVRAIEFWLVNRRPDEWNRQGQPAMAPVPDEPQELSPAMAHFLSELAADTSSRSPSVCPECGAAVPQELPADSSAQQPMKLLRALPDGRPQHGSGTP